MKRIAILTILALAAPFAPVESAFADNPAVSITVDAQAGRRPINPQIYGLTDADGSAMTDLGCPLNRRGGSKHARYNWVHNAENGGGDAFFESVGYASSSPSQDADLFVSTARQASAQPEMTVPMLGWVAYLGPGRARTSSFSVARYGPQIYTDPLFPDAGNGYWTNGVQITWNTPTDASMPVDSTFAHDWVSHLVSQFGTASTGGVRYYVLDREPALWHLSNRDVVRNGLTMDGVRDKTIDYASKIKDVDPGALVIGPEERNWLTYFISGSDLQYSTAHESNEYPDRIAHGGMEYLPWFLDQMRQNELATGRRLLDVFSVHYNPLSGEASDDVSTAMQLRRNRSTRALWDPYYVDENPVVGTQVKLIPRMRGWVNSYYPGTPIAITEYDWGAANHMNGATAEADVLGIFGREGLDMANRKTTPPAGSPAYLAMKMYRNYDNLHSTFGDTSVAATVPDPDTLSAFAAQRTADGALTVMVVNKALSGNTPVMLNVANFAGTGVAHVWQLASAATGIQHLPDLGAGGNVVATTVPPQSITMIIFPSIPGDTPGVYVGSSGAWFLRNSASSGIADISFTYGPAGAGLVPLAGDWDADGVETAGLYNPSTGAFFLKNSNSGGAADITFFFGAANAGLVPIVGDWDGDFRDTVGLYDPTHSTFFIKNTNAGGAADVVFGFGPAGSGWKPLAGDWDFDGDDSVGLYNPSSGTFFLKNDTSPGAADFAFAYGPSNATPIAGDWNGDGRDTVGVYIPATGAWFLRNANSSGDADIVFVYGPPNARPVVGDWDGN
jgi:hypothetical protein